MLLDPTSQGKVEFVGRKSYSVTIVKWVCFGKEFINIVSGWTACTYCISGCMASVKHDLHHSEYGNAQSIGITTRQMQTSWGKPESVAGIHNVSELTGDGEKVMVTRLWRAILRCVTTMIMNCIAIILIQN